MKLWTIAKVVGAVCVLALALVGCGSGDQQDSATSAARLVGPAEFAAVVAEPERMTINVHVPFEGDIPGTDLSIPFDQITQRADELPADRTTPLAIYCRSGPMSTQAAADLTALGYTDVVELQGGMMAWQAEGRPLLGV